MVELELATAVTNPVATDLPAIIGRRALVWLAGVLPLLLAGGCPEPLALEIGNCPAEPRISGASVALEIQATGGNPQGLFFETSISADSPAQVSDGDSDHPTIAILEAGTIVVSITVSDGTANAAGQCVFSAVNCLSDDDCDDGDRCNGDARCASGTCLPGAPPDCPADQVCDPADGSCVCAADAACDDGNPCNGAERCLPNGSCTVGDPPQCPDGFLCDPQVGTCRCQDDSACDDGLFCNGAEACVDGVCASAPSPCGTDQNCDEATGTCLPGQPCQADGDCDDGLFCNGMETCDLQSTQCLPGIDPCAGFECCANEAQCLEGQAGAECSCPLCGDTLFLTLDLDHLVGTNGDDVFTSELQFSVPEMDELATLQSGDQLDGRGGSDLLDAALHGAAAAAPTISSIETFHLTSLSDSAAANGGVNTLLATNLSGLDAVFSARSSADLVIDDLRERTDFGFLEVDDPDVDMTVIFGTGAVTAGDDDSIQLILSGARVGTAGIQTAGSNGFETLHIVSTGPHDNRLAGVVQFGGTSLATCTFGGSANLGSEHLPETIRRLDATALTGDLVLGAGDRVADYAAFSAVDLTDVRGGSGADRVILAGTLDDFDFSEAGQFMDLGGGYDAVQASLTTTLTKALPIRNVEELRLSSASDGVAIDLDGANDLQIIIIEADGAGHALELLNLAGTPALQFRGDGSTAPQTYDSVTLLTATADTLDISIHNRGVAPGGTHAIGTLRSNAADTVRLTVSDGPAQLGGLQLDQARDLHLTATADLDLGTVSGPGNATLVLVDGTAVQGDFQAALTALGSGAEVLLGNGHNQVSLAHSAGVSITITGGSGSDLLIGSDQSDLINGAGGDDDLTPGKGLDTVATGSGADVVSFVGQLSAGHATAILDFSAQAPDRLRFDATSFPDYAGGASVVLRTAATVTDFAGPDNQVIVDTAAHIAGIDTSGGNASNPIAIDTASGQILYDADGNYAAGQIIIGTIPPGETPHLGSVNFEIVP